MSFNAGAMVGEIVSLGLVLAGLHLLFTVLSPILSAMVLSAVLGHMGWYWMMDSGHELGHAVDAGPGALVAAAPWLLPAALIGAMGLFLPRGFGGVPIPSLLTALLKRTEGGGACVP